MQLIIKFYILFKEFLSGKRKIMEKLIKVKNACKEINATKEVMANQIVVDLMANPALSNLKASDFRLLKANVEKIVENQFNSLVTRVVKYDDQQQ